MANSRSNSVYAVWNRLDNGDEDAQFNHSESKNEKGIVSNFRRNTPTGDFKGSRCNNAPTRGNLTRNYEHQTDRRENFRHVDSFQTSNRFEKHEEPQMNRNRYRDKKNNDVSNQSSRNNNKKKINYVQNSNQSSFVEDSRRSHSSNRRGRNRNMKQSRSTQNLDQICQLEDSGQFANQHNNRDFPNKYEDDFENRNGRGNHLSSEQAASKPKIIKPMHLNHMKKLSVKDPTEVLLTIIDRENGFSLLLDQNMKRVLMPYILIILGKAVAASSNMHNNVCKMIITITSNRNFFLLNVQQYLASFQIQKPNEYDLDSLVSFTEFLHKFQITLPSNASEILPILLPLLKITCEKFLTGNRATIASSKLKEIDEQNTYVLEKFTS